MIIDVYESDVGQLLNEICHDLREPVGTIRATAAAALAGSEPDIQVRRRLEQIAGQADWLASIINDCMRTECQDGGERTGDRPANVMHVVNEAVAACRLPPDLARRPFRDITSRTGPVCGPSRYPPAPHLECAE